MTTHDHQRYVRLGLLASALLVALSLTLLVSPLGRGVFALTPAQIDALASAVGISTAVPPNEYNTLAQALTERERTLDERESLIRERESAIARVVADDIRRDNVRILFFIGGALLVLLVLIGANFYFDLHRSPPLSSSGPPRASSNGVVIIP